MKMNFAKTKFISFNPTINFDFEARLDINGKEIETVDEMKLLGIKNTNDLKWRKNRDELTRRAYSKLWMIRRLTTKGADIDDLIDIYCKQVRSVLEFGVPVWNGSITKEEISDIEGVQRSFFHIVLGKEYSSYESALEKLDMESLEERRLKLCITFAKKAANHPKHQKWFVQNETVGTETRSKKTKYKVPNARLDRFKTSPIPYVTDLLNKL